MTLHEESAPQPWLRKTITEVSTLHILLKYMFAFKTDFMSAQTRIQDVMRNCITHTFYTSYKHAFKYLISAILHIRYCRSSSHFIFSTEREF